MFLLILAPALGFCIWATPPISFDSLYVPVYLSGFHGISLPWSLSSLMDPRRVVDFHCSAFFCCCEDGGDDFKALYMTDWSLVAL